MGTYLHGLFSRDTFRHCFLVGLGAEGSSLAFEAVVDETLDRLAEHLDRHLDIERLLGFAAPVSP